MMLSLMKYNISYYIKSARYLPPVLIFAAFLSINYQTMPIDIWSNLHLTSIAVYILSSCVAASFINSEDKTQQYITRLHVKNETTYHLSKIASIIIFLIPFYLLTVLIPTVFGYFARDILFSEILIYMAVYFLVSLLGISVGIFFNDTLFSAELAALAHIVTILVVAIPFDVIFADNPIVVYANHLLPPTNFLADRLHNLGEGAFLIDLNFLAFVAYAMGYAVILIALYNFVIQKKNKE